jgi:hypothetical protein
MRTLKLLNIIKRAPADIRKREDKFEEKAH